MVCQTVNALKILSCAALAGGNMVAEMIKNGQIVPSEVTVNLLLGAMEASGKVGPGG